MAVNLVAAPERKPRQGGIKDVVGSFVNENRLTAGEIGWEASDCGFPSLTRAGCYDTVTPVEAKEFDGVERFGPIGPSFAQYKGISCFLGADSDGASYLDQARASLEQTEEPLIELFLYDWATEGPAGENPFEGTSIKGAISVAERHADRNYPGQPVLIMSRSAALLGFAEGALVRENGKLVSGNGTPVISTGIAGATYVAIVGAVAVYATDIVAHEAPHIKENVDMALAERVYAIGVDCEYRYAVPTAN